MMKKLLLIVLLFTSINSYSQFKIDQIKDVDSEMYTFVKDWYGVRYVTGGTTKKGVDCSGFSKVLYETRFGIELPRIAREQYRATARVNKDSLLPGDLVFFRTKTRSGWHVGVYLMDGYFVHSANHKTGVKINNLSDPYYIRTYLSGGRVQII